MPGERGPAVSLDRPGDPHAGSQAPSTPYDHSSAKEKEPVRRSPQSTRMRPVRHGRGLDADQPRSSAPSPRAAGDEPCDPLDVFNPVVVPADRCRSAPRQLGPASTTASTLLLGSDKAPPSAPPRAVTTEQPEPGLAEAGLVPGIRSTAHHQRPDHPDDPPRAVHDRQSGDRDQSQCEQAVDLRRRRVPIRARRLPADSRPGFERGGGVPTLRSQHA